MSCTHPKILVHPQDFEVADEGVTFSLEGAHMSCLKCKDELPLEDLPLYPEDTISVGIPTDLVDD